MTNRIVIKGATGRVGIGTDAPSLAFHTYSSNTVARFESSSTYVDIQLSNSASSVGFIQYNNSDLRFFAGTGSTPTMTISGGNPGNVGIGTTTPGAKLHVSGGNIRVDSGNGIDFSLYPNAAGMTSELLHDYEEGTWTPTFTANANCSSISLNGTAWYIKIGKLVTYSFVATLQVTTANTKTALIFTLPFAQSALTDRQGGNAALEGPASAYPIAAGTIVDGSSGTSDAYAAWGSSAVNFSGSVAGYFTGTFKAD